MLARELTFSLLGRMIKPVVDSLSTTFPHVWRSSVRMNVVWIVDLQVRVLKLDIDNEKLASIVAQSQISSVVSPQ